MAEVTIVVAVLFMTATIRFVKIVAIVIITTQTGAGLMSLTMTRRTRTPKQRRTNAIPSLGNITPANTTWGIYPASMTTGKRVSYWDLN